MSGSAPRRIAVVAALSALSLLSVASPPAHALSFDRTVYPTGTTAWYVTSGEFNGDSDPDLAVTNLDSDDVSILLGGPGGTFSGATNLPAGADPMGVAVADFNGDSDADLAIANNLSRTVSILLGGPGGTFTGPTPYATAGGPEDVAVGEFNGDSNPDLVVANRFVDNVSVLLGQPGGTFAFRVNYAAGGDPLAVAVGDFNGDFDPDLAVTNHQPPPNVTVLEGQTGGTFGNTTQISAGQNPVGVAVGEFSGDSDPDLAVANYLGASVSILLGTTGSGFTGPIDYGTQTGPHRLATGDLNGDADPDLAIANVVSGNVSILLGAAGSTFVPGGSYGPVAHARSVAIADFNQDNRGDLAVTTDDAIVILLAVDSPSISIGDVVRAEGDSGDTDFTFPVTASGPSSDPMTVTYRTQDGTATAAASDYTAVPPQTLTFAPNQISKTVTVKVTGDIAPEADEDFRVLLSDPVNASIADGSGTGAIADDDHTGYARPKGASPLRAALVPAYASCSSPNRSHGPPLAFGSCYPPQQASSELTVGSPDANGPAANSLGFVRLSALVGIPPTPPDEADLRVATSITDVRRTSDLADYTGEVQVVLTARLTDLLGSGSGDEPQTTEDFPFRVTVPCAATGSTATGSTCALTTTADSLMPGAVPEGKRSIWALAGVHVDDGGPDSDADTLGDNTLFATQGVFVP
jgi:hypothetical protein